jgi:hypothetical protein
MGNVKGTALERTRLNVLFPAASSLGVPLTRERQNARATAQGSFSKCVEMLVCANVNLAIHHRACGVIFSFKSFTSNTCKLSPALKTTTLPGVLLQLTRRSVAQASLPALRKSLRYVFGLD